MVRRALVAEPAEGVAAAVRTLAVLLAAGASGESAWRHLADSGDAAARRIVTRIDERMPVAAAIEAQGSAWREVAAAWEIAVVVGAPLADVLRRVADALTDAGEAADDVRIALAEPTGTARLLLWMPLAGLLLGGALGFDTLGVIATPPGAVVVVLGLLLVLAARAWTARLVRAAAPAPGIPGIHAELTAAALAGGASIDRAVAVVAHTAVCSRDDAERTDEVLRLSRAAGVPAGELLRAAAAQRRHGARVAGRLRAARLSSRLLIPLGVCTLPAFLLLGVAPMLLSILADSPLLP